MKEKQNKRWGLLLISFLCAFLVWLGVVNVADPVMTDTVEVPVEIINSDVLTKNNLTYEVVGKSTTTVQYEIKTTDAYRIRLGFPGVCGYDGHVVCDGSNPDQD